MEEELKRILQSAENPIEIEDDFSSLNKEFILFKNTKKRTDNLNKLHDSLSTYKLTSTNNERTFSV